MEICDIINETEEGCVSPLPPGQVARRPWCLTWQCSDALPSRWCPQRCCWSQSSDPLFNNLLLITSENEVAWLLSPLQPILPPPTLCSPGLSALLCWTGRSPVKERALRVCSGQWSREDLRGPGPPTPVTPGLFCCCVYILFCIIITAAFCMHVFQICRSLTLYLLHKNGIYASSTLINHPQTWAAPALP